MLASQIKPYGKMILVKVDPAEEKTSSGVVIPGSAVERKNTGTVIAVGDGEIHDTAVSDGVPVLVKPWARPGDRVMFSNYGGTELTVVEKDGNKPDLYLLIHDSDLLATINPA